jgi:hypothetical protein
MLWGIVALIVFLDGGARSFKSGPFVLVIFHSYRFCLGAIARQEK